MRKEEAEETDSHIPPVSSRCSRENGHHLGAPAELLATACLRVIGSYDS